MRRVDSLERTLMLGGIGGRRRRGRQRMRWLDGITDPMPRGPAATMSRHSRLQRQVLSLYRELLRAGRGKPGAEARVRAEFRQHACLPRSDVLRIEYLYRRGRRQLQMLRSGHATAMGAFVRTRGPTEESNGAGAPGTLSGEGDDPRKPLDSMRTPKTPLDGR